MKARFVILLIGATLLLFGCKKDSSPTDGGGNTPPISVATSISLALTGGAYSQSNDTIYVAEKDKITVTVTVKDQNGNNMSNAGAILKNTCGTVSNFEVQADSLTTGWSKTGQVYAEIKNGSNTLTSNIIKMTVVYKFFYGTFDVIPGASTTSYSAGQQGKTVWWKDIIGQLNGNHFSILYSDIYGTISYDGQIDNRTDAHGTYILNTGGVSTGTFTAKRR